MKTFIFSMLLTISSLSATAFFGGSQGSILDAAATLESNGYFGDASAQMETYYLEELVIEIPDM